MSELNFRKQLLLNEFKTLSKGKTNEELLPLVLAISNKAKASNITFTNEDCMLVIDSLKDSLSDSEKQLLPKLMLLLSSNI